MLQRERNRVASVMSNRVGPADAGHAGLSDSMSRKKSSRLSSAHGHPLLSSSISDANAQGGSREGGKEGGPPSNRFTQGDSTDHRRDGTWPSAGNNVPLVEMYQVF